MAYRSSRLDKGKWILDPSREARRPPIKIPQVDTTSLIEEHKLTLIGRVTNPKIQKTRALVDFFLSQWRVSGKITGRDLGPHLFQFKFESEQDLQSILAKAPFHFKRWMMILQRWEPVVSDFFTALIPFWITIHGIPLHYWTKPALDTIGEELGPVEGYEVEKGRIRVLVNGLKPLEMVLDISLPSGEIKQVELEYDNLEKHCFICYSLSHEKEECPSQRALANNRVSEPQRFRISQSRTLDRLEAERRRNYERKQSRADPSQWQQHSIRERDPNHRTGSVNIENTNGGTRRSARERLSFSKEDSDRNTMPRTEWRPVGSGSQQGASSKPSQSLVSHTPSPRPQREGGSSLHASAQTKKQNSGGGSLQSQERRSALERIALPTERVPLLQDGVANAESGRLQEVNIQYLEENIQSVERTSVLSTSRLPIRSSLGAVGGTSIPSTSRHPGQSNMGIYDASQSRSPIRTHSEDKVHVSLGLGPLFDLDSEEDASLNLPIATLKSKAPINAEAQAARGKGDKAPTIKKRSLRSPVQGLNMKKRRVTKTQNSPRRRNIKEAGTSKAGTAVAAGATRPRSTIVPRIKKKRTDFRSGPKPLP
ncbi:hypothetical protein Bca101_029767 [Brassica carinata]